MTDENGTAGPADGDPPSDGDDDESTVLSDIESDTAGGARDTGDGDSTEQTDDGDGEPENRPGAPDLADLSEQVADLRAEVDDIDGRTVEKPKLEAELKRYVRRRMRRGRARGWGPYLVLLYGTIMTVAAFRFLDGWFAIGAMLILFLSTLGLYTLFVLVGVGLNLLSIPSRAADAIRRRR